MKKTDESGLTFLLVLSIILLSQSAYAQPAPIVLKLDFPEPKIVGGPTYDNIAYDSIIMAGLDKHGEPGLPVLPFQTVRILIPQESDLQDIEVIGAQRRREPPLAAAKVDHDTTLDAGLIENVLGQRCCIVLPCLGCADQ